MEQSISVDKDLGKMSLDKGQECPEQILYNRLSRLLLVDLSQSP